MVEKGIGDCPLETVDCFSQTVDCFILTKGAKIYITKENIKQTRSNILLFTGMEQYNKNQDVSPPHSGSSRSNKERKGKRNKVNMSPDQIIS